MSRRLARALAIVAALAASAGGLLAWDRCSSDSSRTRALAGSDSTAAKAREAGRTGANPGVRAGGLPSCVIAGKLFAGGKPVVGQVALRAFDDDHLLVTVASAADGTFVLGDRPSRPYTVAATAPGFSILRRTVDCTTSRIDALELFIPGCEHSMRGTIRDANGTPLAGATVSSAGLVAARSDAAGAFTVCYARALEELVFSADGYAPTGRTSKGLGDLDIVLVPEATLVVKVVDETGMPVEGARVIAAVKDQPFSNTVDPFRPSAWLQPGRGITGPDGTVELDARPIELHAVSAQLGDRTSDPAELELASTVRRELTLTLREPTWVRGVVLRNGAPVQGVVVEWMIGAPRAVTGPDGTFALPLPAGADGYVGFDDPWFSIGGDALAVAGKTPHMTIEVGRLGTLRGTVLYRSKPVGGARVVVGYHETFTRADGSFEIYGPRVDEQLGIVAYADELHARGATSVPYKLGTDVEGIEIELAASGSISGTLVDERGAPIVGATIEARDVSTITDAAGAYTLSGFRPESYSVRASVGGRSLTLVKGDRPVNLSAGQDVRGHVLVARLALGTITGTVVDAKGVPVSSAWVYSEPRYRDTHTDDDGRFSLAVGGDAEDSVFTVHAQGAIGQHGRVEGVATGARAEVTLVEPGAVRITCSGAGTERWLVLEKPMQGMRGAECGRIIGSLEPGEYVVRGFETEQPIQVATGVTTEVTVAIPVSSELRVSVTLAGKPLPPGTSVTCEKTTARGSWTYVLSAQQANATHTVAYGRFELACESGAAKGSAAVEVNGPTAELRVDMR